MVWLTHVVTVVCVSLFIGWLIRSTRAGAEVTGQEKRFTYGAPFKVLGVVAGLLAPLGIGALVLLSPPKPEDAWIPACLSLSFMLGGGWFLGESLTCATVDAAGVTKKSLWKGRQSIDWSVVRKVSYSDAWGCFVVEGADGGVIRLSIFLRGTRQFADELEARLPQEKRAQADKGIRIARGELDVYGNPTART